MNDIQLLILEDPNAFIGKLKEDTGHSDSEIADETSMRNDEVAIIDGVTVQYKLVHSNGGGEGEGEHVERVLEFKVGKQVTFLRTTGFYSSYNGTDWSEEWSVVYPRQVVITQYFDAP